MNALNPTIAKPTRPLATLAAVAALAVLTLAGCASTGDMPREEMAVARAAVDRAAGPAGADAPVEVSQARDKLERANAAVARKDYDVARRLAEQAEVDANLAEAKSHSARSDRALMEVREGIRQLREEIARG
jgi:septal ring factor EnvC (AmiA/AmiB activator)